MSHILSSLVSFRLQRSCPISHSRWTKRFCTLQMSKILIELRSFTDLVVCTYQLWSRIQNSAILMMPLGIQMVNYWNITAKILTTKKLWSQLYIGLLFFTRLAKILTNIPTVTIFLCSIFRSQNFYRMIFLFSIFWHTTVCFWPVNRLHLILEEKSTSASPMRDLLGVSQKDVRLVYFYT